MNCYSVTLSKFHRALMYMPVFVQTFSYLPHGIQVDRSAATRKRWISVCIQPTSNIKMLVTIRSITVFCIDLLYLKK